MKTVTPVSGGQSSAYIAANYPSDFLVFALVCIEDKNCTPKDIELVREVSDRIGREFIATAEDDTILQTMLDLEQYLGQRIDWVTGPTFEEVIRKKNGFLPSPLRRYCTVQMKMYPLFEWQRNHCNLAEGEIVRQQIGFRHGESKRASNMLERCVDGVMSIKAVVGKTKNGRNKWADIPYQMPAFPLIDNGIRKSDIVQFWKGKPVRFAQRNNCVGCFNQNPLLLRKRWQDNPVKMEWFAKQERERTRPNDLWNVHDYGISYDDMRKRHAQHELTFEDFADCDSGYCGI